MTDAGGQEVAEGAVLGRYVLLEELGSGGMGVVYAALDPDLDRRIALKLLRTDKIRDPAHRRRDRARLLREAQAMARLDHPNVVTVHDVGTIEGRVYIAMDFIDGETMTAWLARGPHPVAEAMRVLVPAARGLEAAHAAGLIHRDFKPDNVLLDPGGGVHVLDFGLAIGADLAATGSHRAQAPSAASDNPHGVDMVRRMTNPGQIMGTPAYMSPEQHRGRVVDARSDQFSWCVTAWEALYGQRPFGGKNRSAIAFKVVRGEINPPPPEIQVPQHIHAALLRGLAAEPDRRWPSMPALLAAITADPAVALRRRVAVGCAVLAVTAAAGIYLALPGVEAEPTCELANSGVDGVWTGERRAALEAPLAEAPAVRDPLLGHLDRWAGAWTDVRREACVATFERDGQSRSMFSLQTDCLSQRRAELDDLLTMLERGEVRAEYATAAVSGLTGPDRCGDRLALLEAAGREQGDDLDADARQTRRAIEGRIARARIAMRTDAAAHARELAAQALTEAEATGDVLLIAQVELVLGDALRRTGDPTRSAASLHRAAQLAVGRGDLRLAAQAWTSLVWLATGTKEGLDDALELGHYAAGALARLEDAGERAPRARGSLLLAMGALLAERNELPAAEQHFAAALTAFEAVPLAPELAMSHALAARGEVRARRGDLAGARDDLDACLTILDAHGVPAFAPPHLDAALLRADVALAAGGLDDARSRYGAVLELERAEVTVRAVARAKVGVAEVAMVRGDLEAAIDTLEEAIAQLDDADIAGRDLARARFSLAEAMARDTPGDPRAATLARQARELWRQGSPRDRSELPRVDAWLDAVSATREVAVEAARDTDVDAGSQ